MLFLLRCVLLAGWWWRTPFIPVLERQRQVDFCESETSLLYRVSSMKKMCLIFWEYMSVCALCSCLMPTKHGRGHRIPWLELQEPVGYHMGFRAKIQAARLAGDEYLCPLHHLSIPTILDFVLFYFGENSLHSNRGRDVILLVFVLLIFETWSIYIALAVQQFTI